MLYKKEFRTRFNQATDTKGESITAFLVGFDGLGNRYNSKQKTTAYDYSLDAYENHLKAVEALAGDNLDLFKIKELQKGYRFEQLIEL